MGNWVMVGEALADMLENIDAPRERMPVLNREERVMLSPRMWHLIHERDGHVCWVCGTHVEKGAGEIDHLVPRSSFSPEQVCLADKSWNLRLACVACNQSKSNYELPVLPRTVGVTPRCWECEKRRDMGRPDPDELFYFHMDWEELGEAPELAVAAYCGTCGLTSRVPDESWVM